jgi:zinc transport system ATP-binding protein
MTAPQGAPRPSAASLTPRHFTTPDPSQPKVLEADHVTVEIEGRKILDSISFWIPKGEFVVLAGPNGAGKTTLLKTMLGLIRPTGGKVTILGQRAHEVREKVGYVPQRKTFDRDFPARVIDLIVASLRGKWPVRVRDEERERARKVLQRVGGEKLLDRPLAGLSGGETQRAFLARALIHDPVLVILDEPTAGVDVRGRAELLELLAEISRSDELAAILVTHNLAAIVKTAERVVYIDQRLIAWGLASELMAMEKLEAIAYPANPDHEHPMPPDED